MPSRMAAAWTESAGTIRRNVRVSVGELACGSPERALVVNPTYVLAGDTCEIPASLRIGIETLLASSSNSPM